MSQAIKCHYGFNANWRYSTINCTAEKELYGGASAGPQFPSVKKDTCFKGIQTNASKYQPRYICVSTKYPILT